MWQKYDTLELDFRYKFRYRCHGHVASLCYKRSVASESSNPRTQLKGFIPPIAAALIRVCLPNLSRVIVYCIWGPVLNTRPTEQLVALSLSINATLWPRVYISRAVHRYVSRPSCHRLGPSPPSGSSFDGQDLPLIDFLNHLTLSCTSNQNYE